MNGGCFGIYLWYFIRKVTIRYITPGKNGRYFNGDKSKSENKKVGKLLRSVPPECYSGEIIAEHENAETGIIQVRDPFGTYINEGGYPLVINSSVRTCQNDHF